MKTYVTFGQDHRHEIDGKIFDRDCVGVINGTREDVFRIFGKKFCFEYNEKEFKTYSMKYYPRGLIELNNEKFIDMEQNFD